MKTIDRINIHKKHQKEIAIILFHYISEQMLSWLMITEDTNLNLLVSKLNKERDALMINGIDTTYIIGLI
jgi:hypothetical protein